VITVERAADGDREALIALIHRACLFAPVAIEPSDAAIEGLADSLLNDPARMCFVLRDGGRIGGCIGLALAVNHYSGELQAQKLGWYVEPAYAGHGLKLLKAAERWAAGRGAKSLIAASPTPRLSRALNALGFQPMEMIYRKDLSCRS
jgi:GNAT superfamily N-acetyltransferase